MPPVSHPPDYTVQALKSGAIRFACEQPDNGKTIRGICLSGAPNLLGSSGKGMGVHAQISAGHRQRHPGR